MLKKNPCFLKKKNHEQQCSWLNNNNALVSRTLNIYANAINSCLCNSPTKSLTNVNLPSRKLNLEGFSWQKGYRTPLAFISFKNTYYKFLKALYLVIHVLKKGGGVYVIFDENQLRPYSSFILDAFHKNKLKKQAHKNPQSFNENQKQKGIYSKEKELGIVRTSLSSYSSQKVTRQQLLNHNFMDLPPRVRKSPNNRNVYINKAKKRKEDENISWSGDQWVGGTFSNKKQVLKSINLYKTLSRQFFKILEKNISPRYVSLANKFHGNLFSFKQGSNAFLFSREQGNESNFVVSVQGNQAHQYLRKNSLFKSKNLPDLIIVENAEKHRNVIHEAEILKIPLIAFVESDFFSSISIALPLNKLKHYFLAFFLHIIYKMPSS